MPSSRRKFLAGGIAIGLSVSLMDGRVFAQQTADSVSVDAAKVAIQGYDAVAYFTEGRPTKGSPDFEYQWHDARWRFSSAANRELFTHKPDAYAPQFGGFCAGGIIDGIFYRPDPEAWAIVDGRLYLNGSKAGLAEWKQDIAGNIEKGQKRWESLGR